MPQTLRDLVGELSDLAAPRRCGGCAAPGDLLCGPCAAVLRGLATGPGERVHPIPEPDGFPVTWALAPYDGVLAAVLREHKDEGRTDLTPWCALLLRAGLAGVLHQDTVTARAAHDGELLVCAVPSSARARRTRGRDPLAEMLTVALPGRAGEPRSSPSVLRVARRTLDQAGLTARGRAENLRGAMVPARGAERVVRGAVCLLVDDIVTTGSTLVEAGRVLRETGAAHVVAVTIAATRRVHYRQGMEHPQQVDSAGGGPAT